MSLKPPQSGVFNLSNVTYKSNESGKPIRGYGSDSSEKYTDYIYIGSLLSRRTIMFKGFVDAYKLNVDKKLDKKDESDKNYSIFVPGNSTMSWNITIHVPAHSINESVNNLGKISELMKMIQPGPQKAKQGNTFTSLIYVFYKNLISSCDSGMSHTLNRTKGFEDLLYKGVPCYVEDVSFKPELDFGTFILNSKKYPKLYSINLTLNLENNPESIVTSAYGSLGASVSPNYINSFNRYGEYIIETDRVITPFGIRVGDGIKRREFTQEQMNTFSESIGSDFMFISLPYYVEVKNQAMDKNGYISKLGKNVERKFVVFRSFLESFNNSSKSKVTLKDSQSPVDNPIRAEFQSVVFSDWAYDVTLNIPFNNVEESKKELAKLQYLVRMFFTKNDRSATDAVTIMKTQLQNESGFDVSKVKVLLPGYIQVPKSGADKFKYSYSNNFKYLNSSLAMEFTKLAIEFNNEMGFWRDSSGRLYPKAIKIDMSFSLDDGELAKNAEYIERKDESGKVKDFIYQGASHSVPKEPGARNIYNNPNDAAERFPYDLDIIKITKESKAESSKSKPTIPRSDAGPFGAIVHDGELTGADRESWKEVRETLSVISGQSNKIKEDYSYDPTNKRDPFAKPNFEQIVNFGSDPATGNPAKLINVDAPPNDED